MPLTHDGQHRLQHTAIRKYCVVCHHLKRKTSRGWRVQTTFICSACKVPLCNIRGCFDTYHQVILIYYFHGILVFASIIQKALSSDCPSVIVLLMSKRCRSNDDYKKKSLAFLITFCFILTSYPFIFKVFAKCFL